MIVEGTELAAELRRRRLGRAGLHMSLTRTSDSAWVPGAQLNEAPSELLMLAALSLAEPVTSPMQGTLSGGFFTDAPPGRSASG
jgi:hypothetical protein